MTGLGRGEPTGKSAVLGEGLCQCGHPRRLHWTKGGSVEVGRVDVSLSRPRGAPVYEDHFHKGNCAVHDCSCREFGD